MGALSRPFFPPFPVNGDGYPERSFDDKFDNMGVTDAIVGVHHPGIDRSGYATSRNTGGGSRSFRAGVFIYDYQFFLHAGHNTSISAL